MAKRNPFQSIKFVYRRTPLYLKILVLVTLVASTLALLSLRVAMGNYQQQSRVLQAQAIQLQQENQELAQRIAELGSKQSIRRIATEELGLVDPDAKFFTPGE